MGKFLKPDWKKFVLPIILLIMFFIIITTFYNLGYVMNKYGCDMVSLIQERQTEINQNNTIALNQTYGKIKLQALSMQNDLTQTKNIGTIFIFIKTIDPFITVPCEALDSNYCEFYVNKDTYDCFTRLRTNDGRVLFILTGSQIKPYVAVSIISQGLNVLFLIVEGYLVSSLLLFGYSKIRKKKKK